MFGEHIVDMSAGITVDDHEPGLLGFGSFLTVFGNDVLDPLRAALGEWHPKVAWL